METLGRKPFQGITNIIRFNWHFYVLALCAVPLAFLLKYYFSFLTPLIAAISFLILATTVFSLVVSFYVYDLSNLYSLNWLTELTLPPKATIVNINAGFDETSYLLRKKYPDAGLTVFDFYDPLKHTEVSIKRARKAYPPYPETQPISTEAVPLLSSSADIVFCILSAHEIRKELERSYFFQQLAAGLKPNGRIIVVEHSRDLANFVAYTIGFFHFFSKKNWRKVFCAAQLHIEKEQKITPFITAYILQKNGSTP